MRFIRSPYLVQRTFRNLVWRMPPTEKTVYLTFDDGPIPEVTPWVLDILKKFNAHATFFCVGDNVAKHQALYTRIKEEGHAVGNHTYNHLNGWKTKTKTYVENVERCHQVVQSKLYRPPYGKFSLKQYKLLKPLYRFIMWDILSYDFDDKLPEERCYKNVIKKIRPGSIVVFHDSIKAEKNMKFTLLKVLEDLTAHGYRFKSISAA